MGQNIVSFFFLFSFFIGRKITSINNKQKLHHLIKKKYTSWKRVCSNKQILSLIYAEKSQMPKTCIDNKCASLLLVDMAKRVSRVKTGRGLSRVVSQVKLTRIFQTKFFFFLVDAICQLFMSSLIVIRFSLVILLPITTKHLT